MDVAIVGAGFGGLLTAARLRELGVDNLRLIDKAADVGGTWYFNRYPGIACDVESYVYMPLLEETGYIPTEKYAKGPEIFAHCQRVLPNTTTCTATHACRPRFTKYVGMDRFPSGSSAPITAMRSRARISCRWPTAI